MNGEERVRELGTRAMGRRGGKVLMVADVLTAAALRND